MFEQGDTVKVYDELTGVTRTATILYIGFTNTHALVEYQNGQDDTVLLSNIDFITSKDRS